MTALQKTYEQAKAEYEQARQDYNDHKIEMGALQRAEDKRYWAGVRWFRTNEAKALYGF